MPARADALGVDIIQNCEVTGFRMSRAAASPASRPARARSSAALSAWPSPAIPVVLAAKAGFRLPVTSYALQAMVSEPVKPVLDTVVLSPATGTYVSQSDKGELVIRRRPRPLSLLCAARQSAR